MFEISGKCISCDAEYKVLFDNGSVRDVCKNCGSIPFECKRIAGVVYVIENKHQTGVKIGMTTKPIKERLKSLSSTGVPGSFDIVALFVSSNPKQDEARAHKKLQKFKLEKEHFDVDPIKALLGIRSALNKDPIFYDDKIQERYHLERDKARIEMKLRLSKGLR